MPFLNNVTNINNPNTAVQLNFEALERLVFTPETPTWVSGTPTAIIGPPTTGAHVLREKWVDAFGAEWKCITAGTPGTWVQVEPANMVGDPTSGTIPVGYLIRHVNNKGVTRICTIGGVAGSGSPPTWAYVGIGLNAVADATGSGDVVAQLNALLARCRQAGIINA